MDIIIATSSADLRIALELLVREEADLSIVGTTNTVEGLSEWVETIHPDLLLLDWELAGASSQKLLGRVSRLTTSPKIIVLGKYLRTEESALEIGADSFVLKGDSPKKLLDAIREFDPKKFDSQSN